jgi:diguanylate cyclase (GGDEF)-like protein
LLCRTLQAFCGRPGDLAIRYGGEEFGLLLGSTDSGESLKIADAARQVIYELDMNYRDTRMTVSAGVASAIPDGKLAETSLILEADKALYQAKQAGRNKVAIAQHAAVK